LRLRVRSCKIEQHAADPTSVGDLRILPRTKDET
jgi:hypothetical protein